VPPSYKGSTNLSNTSITEMQLSSLANCPNGWDVLNLQIWNRTLSESEIQEIWNRTVRMIKKNNVEEILFEPIAVKSLKLTLSDTPTNLIGIREILVYEAMNVDREYEKDT
jgi:hypothetical protein